MYGCILVLTTLIILLHFTFALFTTAPKQISGAYVFAYEKITLQQCRRLLSSPSPPFCCPTNLSCVTQMFANKCRPTNVDQQLLATICWSCVCGLTATQSIKTHLCDANDASELELYSTLLWHVGLCSRSTWSRAE